MSGLEIEPRAPIEGFAVVVSVLPALFDPLSKNTAKVVQLFWRHGIVDHQNAVSPELFFLRLCERGHGPISSL